MFSSRKLHAFYNLLKAPVELHSFLFINSMSYCVSKSRQWRTIFSKSNWTQLNWPTVIINSSWIFFTKLEILVLARCCGDTTGYRGVLWWCDTLSPHYHQQLSQVRWWLIKLGENFLSVSTRRRKVKPYRKIWVDVMSWLHCLHQHHHHDWFGCSF